MAETVWSQVRPSRIQGWWRTRTVQEWIRNAIVYALLIILGVIFAFPFFWMVTSALKPQYQIFVWPPQWIPDPIMWENFAEALGNPLLPFHLFFRNTMIIEVAVLTGRLLSCTLVAYGFARLRAPGKNVIFAILLATLMLPAPVTMIPKFILFNRLGWVNTFLPLTVPHWFGEAYAIFLMRQFFMSIPRELEEAARIDGASTLQVIRYIIVPLSVPVTVHPVVGAGLFQRTIRRPDEPADGRVRGDHAADPDPFLLRPAGLRRGHNPDGIKRITGSSRPCRRGGRRLDSISSLARHLRYGKQRITVTLAPGGERRVRWTMTAD